MSDQFAHLEELRAALIKLDQRRVELVAEIQQIQNEIAVEQDPDSSGVNAHSPEGDKIRLFRELFAGRIDVFPVRFESRKSGRSGYQPACKNEWRPGVCRKPKVKCAKLPPSRKTKDQISGRDGSEEPA